MNNIIKILILFIGLFISYSNSSIYLSQNNNGTIKVVQTIELGGQIKFGIQIEKGKTNTFMIDWDPLERNYTSNFTITGSVGVEETMDLDIEYQETKVFIGISTPFEFEFYGTLKAYVNITCKNQESSGDYILSLTPSKSPGSPKPLNEPSESSSDKEFTNQRSIIMKGDSNRLYPSLLLLLVLLFTTTTTILIK
ncbi:hypothetical protein PPL_06401 [Heterostelium album PN500]|uniref:Uncharacterized protein n=1 Tax=Heterostelium pallidum (strain ATCC 26659 / Pp 5 / PN500) TaxID=670386 RepID=D3BD21_HETP5|nr:hypothetical protein PPL_06401 [Heterostelium album PN500]EFA80813.1 hypothetical protein PPL_06401 [Heterostelium album PN500]|eukprot:XP_020432932.1 hypothetical protein PPL_06401 [Heterostelium album PN500]